MHSAFRFVVLLVAAAFLSGPAMAQVKQIQLSEKQIQSFLAAQKEIAKLTEKMQDGPNAKPDPKVEAAVQAAATKNGFASFGEYSDVFDNISMIMSGLDPKTKAFSEPKIAIQKEMDEVKADKSIPEATKEAATGRTGRGAQVRGARKISDKHRSGEEILRSDRRSDPIEQRNN